MDVFGSGKGWAGVIRFNERLRRMFDAFYARPDTLSLGACNGCQTHGAARLGADPRHRRTTASPASSRNRSGRFESRWTRVKVLPSPAVHLAGMEGSILGIWSQHGEGRLIFPGRGPAGQGVAPLAFVDAAGRPTETYPVNPTVRRRGRGALLRRRAPPRLNATSRAPFLPWQWEWMPPEWKRFGASPWLRLFQNMRVWLDDNRLPGLDDNRLPGLPPSTTTVSPGSKGFGDERRSRERSGLRGRGRRLPARSSPSSAP